MLQQAAQKITDMHIHSFYSFDSETNFTQIIESAKQKNIYAAAVTDHCELAPRVDTQLLAQTRQANLAVRQAGQTLPEEMLLLAGIELGQSVHNPAVAKQILEQGQYDFVLASIHNIRGYKDFYFMDFSSYPPEQCHTLLELYFQEMLETAAEADFDSLAHLTYPIRYINGDFQKGISLEQYLPVIDSVFKTLISRQKALEVNTAGLRKKIGQISPEFALLHRYYQLGGRLLTIGSDAHYPQDIGEGIAVTLPALKDIGFTDIYCYKKRTPFRVPII